MSSIRIVSSRPPHTPVRCRVSEYSETELVRTSLCNGAYDVADPARAMLLMITPLDGHWSKAVDYGPDLQEIACAPIAGNIDVPWWQDLVCSASAGPRSAAKLKIGIIDLLYDAPEELKHVSTAGKRRFGDWAEAAERGDFPGRHRQAVRVNYLKPDAHSGETGRDFRFGSRAAMVSGLAAQPAHPQLQRSPRGPALTLRANT